MALALGLDRCSRPVVVLYALFLSALTVAIPALVLVTDPTPVAIAVAVAALGVGYAPVGLLVLFETSLGVPG